jgi:hypothetical protein
MHILNKHRDNQIVLPRIAAEEVIRGAAGPVRLRVLYAHVSTARKWIASVPT